MVHCDSSLYASLNVWIMSLISTFLVNLFPLGFFSWISGVYFHARMCSRLIYIECCSLSVWWLSVTAFLISVLWSLLHKKLVINWGIIKSLYLKEYECFHIINKILCGLEFTCFQRLMLIMFFIFSRKTENANVKFTVQISPSLCH